MNKENFEKNRPASPNKAILGPKKGPNQKTDPEFGIARLWIGMMWN